MGVLSYTAPMVLSLPLSPHIRIQPQRLSLGDIGFLIHRQKGLRKEEKKKKKK